MTSTEGGAQGAAAFIAKARAREPEMAFAEVFCPRGLRERFALWGALVFEWREAAYELSDARPTEAKCAWWADEALRCAQSAPRHPLTIALAAPGLPWGTLARALVVASQAEAARPIDRDAALATAEPLASAIATVEGALFGASAGEDAKRAVAVHLVGERLQLGDGGLVPLSLLARHGNTGAELGQPGGEPVLRDWARELAEALPSDPSGACLYRRARAAFDGWRLRERARGARPLVPPFRAVLLAWRAARKARWPG